MDRTHKKTVANKFQYEQGFVVQYDTIDLELMKIVDISDLNSECPKM